MLNEYTLRVCIYVFIYLRFVLIVQFDNVDVFCEKGVFELDATRRILEKAKQLGYRVNFHAEELSCISGVEVGALVNF